MLYSVVARNQVRWLQWVAFQQRDDLGTEGRPNVSASNQGENFGPLKDAEFAAKQSVELDLDMYLDTWESEMLDLIVTL